jgi:hypothetical protein
MIKIKSLSILNENTYPLICWRLQENNLNFHNRWEEKKMRWNERGDKWTEGVVAGIYNAVLPTALPTDYLNNIIFNYSICKFQTSVGKFWILH